jgi:hypothetical protein
MLKFGRIFGLIVAAMLFASPTWAVTGEVNVVSGGQAVPGAQVALEIDGQKIKAKPDPKREGVHVFNVTEEQAAKPAKLIVTKDGETTTEDIAPINECAKVNIGGKERCVLETAINLAPAIGLGIAIGRGMFGGMGGGGLCVAP